MNYSIQEIKLCKERHREILEEISASFCSEILTEEIQVIPKEFNAEDFYSSAVYITFKINNIYSSLMSIFFDSHNFSNPNNQKYCDVILDAKIFFDNLNQTFYEFSSKKELTSNLVKFSTIYRGSL